MKKIAYILQFVHLHIRWPLAQKLLHQFVWKCHKR